MEYVRERYVEFLFPGSFFVERDSRKIADRDLSRIKVPDGAFGFIFADNIMANVVIEGETVFLTSGRINESSTHYYGGKFYTVEDFKRNFPEEKTLIEDAIYNEWKGLVKCRTGNWRPFLEGDILLEEKK